MKKALLFAAILTTSYTALASTNEEDYKFPNFLIYNLPENFSDDQYREIVNDLNQYTYELARTTETMKLKWQALEGCYKKSTLWATTPRTSIEQAMEEKLKSEEANTQLKTIQYKFTLDPAKSDKAAFFMWPKVLKQRETYAQTVHAITLAKFNYFPLLSLEEFDKQFIDMRSQYTPETSDPAASKESEEEREEIPVHEQERQPTDVSVSDNTEDMLKIHLDPKQPIKKRREKTVEGNLCA